jgi:hypothetical protein
MKREVAEVGLAALEGSLPSLKDASATMLAGRKAILENVRDSCGATLADALEIQARHSGGFMTSRECQHGVIGAMYKRTMEV